MISHLHLTKGSLLQNSLSLRSARSSKEAALMVKDYAMSHPDHPWIIGMGWDSSFWEGQQLPDRFILDECIPDRPVFLFQAEGHSAWLNSCALHTLTITKETDDPVDGEIKRDENGEPLGILVESALSLAKQVFDLPFHQQINNLKGFLAQAAQFGITSVNDMFLSAGKLEFGNPDIYCYLEESNELTVRIHFHPTLDGNFEKAEHLQNKYQTEKVRFSGLKQFVDGVISSNTAMVLEPYTNVPDSYGEPACSLEELQKWIIEADRRGFRVRLHAIGDRAVRTALHMLESAAKQNNTAGLRHTIEHIELLHPDDLTRFKELGIIVSIQPEHIAVTEKNLFFSFIEKEKEDRTYLTKTLQDTGAILAFGSDFPVVPLTPIMAIYRAVTRINDGNSKETWNPKEKISIAEALRNYTMGPAYGCFRENEMGTLKKGNFADIVVLSNNLFTISLEDIKNTEVALTVFDGKIVFSK
ncbi:UNVERIFIED_CONTAM: putative amidohydrolase YtcJ [Brevibacillus sp. OAP136]